MKGLDLFNKISSFLGEKKSGEIDRVRIRDEDKDVRKTKCWIADQACQGRQSGSQR